jgi:hypothetical protein
MIVCREENSDQRNLVGRGTLDFALRHQNFKSGEALRQFCSTLNRFFGIEKREAISLTSLGPKTQGQGQVSRSQRGEYRRRQVFQASAASPCLRVPRTGHRFQ